MVAERVMRGSRLGAVSYETDRNHDLAPRQIARYRTENGEEFEVPQPGADGVGGGQGGAGHALSFSCRGIWMGSGYGKTASYKVNAAPGLHSSLCALHIRGRL